MLQCYLIPFVSRFCFKAAPILPITISLFTVCITILFYSATIFHMYHLQFAFTVLLYSLCFLSLRKHEYSNILKISPPKTESFLIKKSNIFQISAQKIDCGSNEYPQSIFLSRNKKYYVYPCKPQFSYIKVGFKGQNYIGMFSWCHVLVLQLMVQNWAELKQIYFMTKNWRHMSANKIFTLNIWAL